MAIIREEDLALDAWCPDVTYVEVGLADPRAVVVKVCTYSDDVTSKTPRALIRDTGEPEPEVEHPGVVHWKHSLKLVCVRVKRVPVELPDDAGKFLGIVTEPTASWYVFDARARQTQGPRVQSK